jgi:hypothetical protein
MLKEAEQIFTAKELKAAGKDHFTYVLQGLKIPSFSSGFS